jgi:hypothetical protein
MDVPAKSLNSRWLVFAAVLLVALGWSLATNHVWEDFYITFRSSKNLVAGYGLVFDRGERLHTFTSPLGVLLPAAASALTGGHSDPAAIWVFRIWGAAALAGAAVLLWTVARRLQYGTFAAVALVAFMALDAKTVDFTTNGMETGFLLLFIAYALWAMLVCRERRWLHLGLAWGTLMWTRPDSFLYIGLLSAGVFFFNDPARTGLTREQWLKLFLQAAAVCTVVYLPWFMWAWWYYGTPVPHTITAKGGDYMASKNALGVFKTLIDLPLNVWRGATSLESTFLPSYFQIGGWPDAALTVARWVGLVLAFQWVLPLWRVEVRVASFAFCGLHVYLSYFPYFPFPWYLPAPSLLAAVTFGGMIAQLLALAKRGLESRDPIWPRLLQGAVLSIVAAGLGAEGWLTWQMKREMTYEQIYSATGNRRRVGEWLKENAKPGDTVQMEPLGHIGYFSGLKTYDYPGLSSKEMVYAVHALGAHGGHLAEYLCPDWLVLRPWEYADMHAAVYRLFGEGFSYQLVKEFNRMPEVEQLDVYGRKYIEFDSHLLVFKRQVPKRYMLDATVKDPFAGLGLPGFNVGGQLMHQVHATGIVSFKVPAHATHLRLSYGLPEATYTGNPSTDGVKFVILWTNGLKSQRLLVRTLEPHDAPDDRGAQEFETELPAHRDGAGIILLTLPGETDTMDWSCWGAPEFR